MLNSHNKYLIFTKKNFTEKSSFAFIPYTGRRISGTNAKSVVQIYTFRNTGWNTHMLLKLSIHKSDEVVNISAIAVHVGLYNAASAQPENDALSVLRRSLHASFVLMIKGDAY